MIASEQESNVKTLTCQVLSKKNRTDISNTQAFIIRSDMSKAKNILFYRTPIPQASKPII